MDIRTQEKKETQEENLCERGSEKAERRDKQEQSKKLEKRKNGEKLKGVRVKKKKRIGKTGNGRWREGKKSKGKICKRK